MLLLASPLSASYRLHYSSQQVYCAFVKLIFEFGSQVPFHLRKSVQLLIDQLLELACTAEFLLSVTHPNSELRVPVPAQQTHLKGKLFEI